MFKSRCKKWELSKKLILSLLLFPLFFTPASADVFDFGLEARVDCGDILGDIIGDLLDINIGVCSLSLSGMSTCQRNALSQNTITEMLMGRDYRYVYGGCSSPSLNTSSWLGGNSSAGTGQWHDSRLKSIVNSGNIERGFNRRAYYIKPDTQTMTFAGGQTTLDTQKKIIEDAQASSLFSDGKEESFIASASSSTEDESCREKTDLESIQCEFKKNVSTHKKVSDSRNELIDAETQRTAGLIDISTTPPVIIGFPSEDFSSNLPLEKQRNFRSDGNYAIITESIFRGKMAAINNHRKNMSDLMIFKSSLGATSTYPSVAKENAINISAGELP